MTTNYDILPKNRSCRSCGKALNVFEYGPGKNCPRCGKESAPIDIKDVHIGFSVELEDLYRLHLDTEYVVGVDFVRIYFTDKLDIGEISDSRYAISLLNLHKHGCTLEDFEKTVQSKIDRLSRISDSIPIYLWVDDTDVNSYLCLLKYSELFKRFDKVYLVRCFTKEDILKGCYNINDVFARRTLITRAELDAMTAEYGRVLAMGGEYRIGYFGEVHACSAEYLESFVLKNLTRRFRKFGTLFDKVNASFRKATGFYFGYNKFLSVLFGLLTKGQIESDSHWCWWGNIPAAVLRYRLSSTRPALNSHSDALQLLCRAFEYGHTQLLYSTLAETATLELVDEGTSYEGRDNIIAYIESEGLRRVCDNNETVRCTVMRVIEGERYGIGDYCIRLTYTDKEQKKEQFIVKACYDAGLIRGIRIFYPHAPLAMEEAE